jgi:hypothetical protein
MAGLKTPPKKKRDSSKPSPVLVIFLVFFILLSIGLGIWGYYGYAGQERLQTTAKEEKKKTQEEKDIKDYHLFMESEARMAIGSPGNPKEPVVDPDDAVFVAQTREEFLKDGSKYSAGSYGKYYEPMKKLLNAFKTDLGSYDEAGKKYPTTYRALVAKLQADLKTNEAQLATTQSDLKAANDKFETLQANQDKYWKSALADIKKGNAAALASSSARTKAMEEQFALNQKLNQDFDDFKRQAAEKEEATSRRISKLIKALEKTGDKADFTAAPNAADKAGAEQPLHALILDVSQGKPLWDRPLGKLTRVDLPARQAYINLGSANDMKPEVTFSIFAAGPTGRAERTLKGTIEVIRVLDAHSSLARITCVYDAEGREIVLGDATRSQPIRETENALKEGDLLFNAFFGAHVAVAGNIRFGGQVSDSPAEQMRILASFVHFLNQQGISVDAYLDLNDGQINGTITSRTRYLIRGDDVVDPNKPAEFKRKPAKDDEAEEKKDEAPKTDGLPDRFKLINDAAAKMRREAADKGLFVISVENFLNVVGYRQPRSAAYGVPTGFRPSAIIAGQPAQNQSIQAAPAPKTDEKNGEKAPEKTPDEK